MTRKKIILIASIVFLILLIISGITVKNSTQTKVKELFRMNKELQEENYYMAEFEFKMLGIAYYLDKGSYCTALSRLNQLHKQLKTKEGLIKVPEFTSKEEELEFYLNLQNSKTGAFMDDSFPLNTYHGPTENVLLHIEALAKETGQPLRLKYPLKYLDKINTPDKLIAVLNDWCTVGWIASKFPQTSFHNARDILSLARDSINYNAEEVDLVIQNNNLYDFSPEWKKAMIQWFWENQDPETGLWGPKSKSGKLQKKDLNNTASIMKAFVDNNGNNIHKSFPLRYKNEIFESILELSSETLPEDDELDEWHEWQLKTSKSIKTLTRYLWNDASRENKKRAGELIEDFIKINFEKCYIPQEGAFSYYPESEHATLDGTRVFFIFRDIGVFSSERQKRLWGEPEKNITDLGSYEISKFSERDFHLIKNYADINSFRLYKTAPDYDNLTSHVLAVVYPQKTLFLDIMDLTPKIKHWIETTSQSVGNWVSRETIMQELAKIKIELAPVYEGKIPLALANEVLQNNRELVIIGFDVLQIPRYRIAYKFVASKD